MNSVKFFCIVACLVAAVAASPNRKSFESQSSLKPSQWFTPSELEAVPAIDEITMEQLESMPLEKGAQLMQKIYHLSQIKRELEPAFVPSPSNVPVYIYKANGEKVQATLNNFASVAQQQPEFGNDEVTIFITGLPKTCNTVRKAIQKLVEAYMQRYNAQNQRQKLQTYDYVDSSYSTKNQQRTSSEEDSKESWKQGNPTTGNFVIIDLGSTFTSFKRYVMLDIEETGAMIAKSLMPLVRSDNVLHESIHIVAQGVASHVAGAAANEFTRLTGHKLRRITALDPSKIFARQPHTLNSLSRGDADFVDAIHTSVYGLGTNRRVGDIDFYPNGPAYGVPGATNVIEACMRATRYFAESVRPGNERNFPAVQAKSLKDYQENRGIGKRTYMGISVDYDLEGDYFLKVNPASPFGKRAPATKQTSYHGEHSQSWKNYNEY